MFDLKALKEDRVSRQTRWVEMLSDPLDLEEQSLANNANTSNDIALHRYHFDTKNERLAQEASSKKKLRRNKSQTDIYIQKEAHEASYVLFPEPLYAPTYQHAEPRLPEELSHQFKRILDNHYHKKAQRSRFADFKDMYDDIDSHTSSEPVLRRVVITRRPWKTYSRGIYPYPKLVAKKDDSIKQPATLRTISPTKLSSKIRESSPTKIKSPEKKTMRSSASVPALSMNRMQRKHNKKKSRFENYKSLLHNTHQSVSPKKNKNDENDQLPSVTYKQQEHNISSQELILQSKEQEKEQEHNIDNNTDNKNHHLSETAPLGSPVRTRRQASLSSFSHNFASSFATLQVGFDPETQTIQQLLDGRELTEEDGHARMTTLEEETSYFEALYDEARAKISKQMQQRKVRDDIKDSDANHVDPLRSRVKKALEKKEKALLTLKNEQHLVTASQLQFQTRNFVRFSSLLKLDNDVYIYGRVGKIVWIGPMETLGKGDWVGIRLVKPHGTNMPLAMSTDCVKFKNTVSRIEEMIEKSQRTPASLLFYAQCDDISRAGNTLWTGGSSTFGRKKWISIFCVIKAMIVWKRFLRNRRAFKIRKEYEENQKNKNMKISKDTIYHMIELYVSSLSSCKTATIDSIVYNLTLSHLTRTSIQRAFALYCWVCHHFSWVTQPIQVRTKDMKHILMKQYKTDKDKQRDISLLNYAQAKEALFMIDHDVEQRLNSEQVTTLIHVMMGLLDISSVRIHGISKAKGCANSGEINQVWNAFFADSSWHLLDCTLGSGYYYETNTTNTTTMNKQLKWNRNFISEYFNTSINNFTLQHYPISLHPLDSKVSIDTFIQSDLKKDEFLSNKYIMIDRGYIKYKLDIIVPQIMHAEMNIHKSTFQMIIRAKSSLRFLVNISHTSDISTDASYAQVEYSPQVDSHSMRNIYIHFSLPKEEIYNINIMCKEALKIHDSWISAILFKLNYRDKSHNIHIHNIGYLKAVDPINTMEKCFILEPIQDAFRIGHPHHFKLLVPNNVTEMIVINNGKWLELTRGVNDKYLHDYTVKNHVIFSSQATDGLILKRNYPDISIYAKTNDSKNTVLLYTFMNGNDTSYKHGNFRVSDNLFWKNGIKYLGFSIIGRTLRLNFQSKPSLSLSLLIYRGWKKDKRVLLSGIKPILEESINHFYCQCTVCVDFPLADASAEFEYTISCSSNEGELFTFHVLV